MRIKSLITSGLVFVLLSVHAQIAVGEWRDHLSYGNATQVENAGKRVYVLTLGSIFYLDQATASVEKLTKVNGLSDVGASSIRYNAASDILIVGYTNGNVDLITSDGLYNIPDIKHKQIAADKTIHSIYTENSTAWLCTGFGIVVLDLARKEIRDTYIIGPLGTYLCVYDLDYDGQTYFYAATEKGIYKAEKNNPGLVDFSNWSLVTNIPNYNKKFYSVKCFYTLIFAFLDQTAWNSDTVYVNMNGEWNPYYTDHIKNVVRIEKSGGNLYIVETYRLFRLEGNGHTTFIWGWINGSGMPTDAASDASGRLWISDAKYGLVYRSSDQGSWSHTAPNGPDNYRSFSVTASGNMVVATAGGRNSAWGNLYYIGNFFTFENETWTSYNRSNTPVLDSLPDICSAAIDPEDPSHFYVASYGGGLLEMRNGEVVKRFNEFNSTLQNLDTINHSTYLRIGGMAFDEDRNLWVTNCGVTNSLSVRKANGTWKGFALKTYINEGEIAQVLITQNNHKWLVLPRGKGLFAFDDNGTIDNTSDDRWQRFSVLDENGELITNDIYSIAEDHDGRIWLGTNKGVVIYYNPENVFSGESFYASQIKIPNENPGQANYLLESQTVTAIRVDGANRKWFGTTSGGAFLMSEDGTEQILNFTEENCPLFSNSIIDIAINGKTGEIFFITDKGMLSYKGTATDGDDFFRHVYTYPNPVPPGYSGYITITGLAANVNVKITDISGNLVYETTSEGGQATWKGTTLSGRRVQSGVYLVFTSNEDGTKTHVTKILFIN